MPARRPPVKDTAIERGPRQYLAHPEQYGHVAEPDPARLPVGERHKAEAAVAQSEVARHVDEQMTRLELSYADIAKALGLKTDEQVKRLLRGESGLSLERIFQLGRITGLAVTVTVEPKK